MESYLHRVVGLYTSRAEADEARDLVVAQGIAPTQIRVLTAESTGAGGTAVGTAAGAGVSIAMAAAKGCKPRRFGRCRGGLGTKEWRRVHPDQGRVGQWAGRARGSCAQRG